MEYTAIFKKQSNGWYFAQCEQVPGAMTQGRTIEEAKENLKEAIALILEDEKEDFRKEHKGLRFIRRKIAVL
jgi:predicted RNase H-like HicB family nuclease